MAGAAAPLLELTPDARWAALQALTSFWSHFLITAAADLGLFELLAAGTGDAREMAQRCGAEPDRLARLLAALAALGLVERGAGSYRLSAGGRCFVAGGESSLRPYLTFARDFARPAWERLDLALNGGDAFAAAHGGRFYETAESPDAGIFAGLSATLAADAAAALELGAGGSVLDIGAGSGGFAAALRSLRPDARVVTFDRDGCAGPDRLIGDFFDGVPAGFDRLVLMRVLHNWDDADALRLLRACRTAMAPAATLTVFEPVQGSSPYAALWDINAMVLTGGRLRAREELAALAALADLRLLGSRWVDDLHWGGTFAPVP